MGSQLLAVFHIPRRRAGGARRDRAKIAHRIDFSFSCQRITSRNGNCRKFASKIMLAHDESLTELGSLQNFPKLRHRLDSFRDFEVTR
jgi:hypothetical protein